MTLARQPMASTVHFPIKEVKPPQPIHYPVMLHKKGGRWNEFYIGYVVTHLDLQDWCEENGYKLVTLHRGARPANPNEFTDLFQVGLTDLFQGEPNMSQFDVVEFSFDNYGAAKSKVVQSHLSKDKAKELVDKLNEKRQRQDLKDDLGGGSNGLVAFGVCPSKK